MKAKSFSAKRNAVVIAAACLLTLTTALGLYFGLAKNGLIFAPTLVNSGLDRDNPAEVAGHVDYVFVGRVEKYNKVTYKDVFERETEDGTEIVGSPYTSYDITVLENIKGGLKVNETIPIVKNGGVSLDGIYLVLEEGDFLPDVGDVSVFFVSAQPDGVLLLPGKGFTIKLTDSKLSEKAVKKMSSAQVQQAEREEINAIEASPIYQSIVEACENAVPFERERFTAPAEFLEDAAE